ncbi:hypothetical protein MG293_001567 [Ovis ammon polii]|uniref:Uncharacterized protein n=1 Tax=Ovis ammon polii TaxID=230172 RepID=A0AAD4YIY6_OVIAM|nr:hypothetical protein MG293_001567 [Ovis ammon polii]
MDSLPLPSPGKPYESKRGLLLPEFVLQGLNIYFKRACKRKSPKVASVVSDSVRPRRRQPTRFRSPWDSPGKDTGVGCHFLLQYMKVKSESEVAQSYPTLSDPMDCSLPGSSIHGIFQTRVLEYAQPSFSAAIVSLLCLRNKPPVKILQPVPIRRSGPSLYGALISGETNTTVNNS